VRIDAALRAARSARRPIVVPYLMVDRGRRAKFGSTVRALAAGGATALELGFPFSDPIADGPVLEASANRALANGTRWSDLLTALKTASAALPVAVMTYANPVLQHGLEGGMRALSQAGATGLIVPDLSFEEAGPWIRASRSARVSLILLSAPAASAERTARIARRSRGFLYLVSRYGTTGRQGATDVSELSGLVRAAHRAAPSRPVLVGFGVRDAATARDAVSSGADGVIVGSALEELIVSGAGPVRIERWLTEILRGASGNGWGAPSRSRPTPILGPARTCRSRGSPARGSGRPTRAPDPGRSRGSCSRSEPRPEGPNRPG
jgi:tryptophan synthase alpha chain